MRRNWRHFGRLAALAALGVLIAWTSQAGAQEEGSVMVGGPTVADESAMPTLPSPAEESNMPTMPPPAGESAMPMLPAPVDLTPPAPAPAPAAPAEVRFDLVEGHGAVIKPCLDYRTRLGARRMLRCQDQVQVTMQTQNPADRCLYEIPLCIPSCCTGEPCVTSRCGFRGRGVVEYCWPCGFEAEVVFRARGGVEVHYRG